jgi:D-xylose transport system substrate-binding protein
VVHTPRAALAASALALALAAAGCTNSGTSGTTGSGASADANASGSIALLLPESQTARYEKADRPYFTTKVQELCSACTVDYKNANQSEPTQLQQAEQALTGGAKVLVLDPVNGETARTIVQRAKQKNVPVISYDRLVTNADVDYYISFDNEEVGRLQGQALLDKLTADGKAGSGSIVMINGSPTDNNAKLFKKGAHSVLDGKVTIGKEYDTKEWKPKNAQDEMDQAITALGKDKIVGVYAANDGTAGGAYAAMKAAGFNPIPPLTGQDAEVAGVQRIIADRQFMTVYKAIKPEAEKAAELAVALLRGQAVQGADDTVNNGQKDVKSVLLTPVAVTKANVKDTVIQDAFVTPAELCAGEFKASCTTLGIS